MSSVRIPATFAIIVAFAAAGQAQCQAPPQTTPQPPPVAPTAPPSAGAAPSSVTPPAPAFRAGDTVADSEGVAIGQVQTLTETPAGPMVVVRIDGKMVTLPQATLRMEGQRIVSGQTKAQILAAAGATG